MMNLEEKNKEVEQLKIKIELLEKKIEKAEHEIHLEKGEREADTDRLEIRRYDESPHGSIEAIIMDNKFLVPATESKVVVELPIKCKKKWKSDRNKIDCTSCGICENVYWKSIREWDVEKDKIKGKILGLESHIKHLEKQLTSSK